MKTLNAEFLTNRDIEILKIAANFGGKVYDETLIKTLWINHTNAKRQVLNRMYILKNRYKVFNIKATGLTKPRSAFVLTDFGKALVYDLFEKKIGSMNITTTSVYHTILEQITFFWLNKIGKKLERTSVIKWSKEHSHTPDFVYYIDNNPEKMVYVEVERMRKSSYTQIFVNFVKDNVYKVLYVVENEKRLCQFAKCLPRSERLMLVTIDELIRNAQNGKIGAKKQKEIENECK